MGGVAALGREGQVFLVEESAPGGRLFSRRRRANVAGGRQHRHEVKVTAEEEGVLLRLAEEQHVTVPRLLVESALAQRGGPTSSERRNLVIELFGVHRLLAAVSNNVNQIARATNASGEVQADLLATLAAVRSTAERVDAALEGLRPR